MSFVLKRRGAMAVAAGLAAAAAVLALALAGAAEESTATVSEEQARAALQEALRYVEAGVPFRMGGKITLEEYLALKERDPAAAEQAGIDASGLVVNAFRAAVPDLVLFAGPPEQGRTATHVTSAALFRYNTVPVPLDQARPGDLLFFRSLQGDAVTGVGIVSALNGPVVRVVVASASRGRVVDVGINTRGEYWATYVAGLGRLVVSRPTPAQAATGQP